MPSHFDLFVDSVERMTGQPFASMDRMLLLTLILVLMMEMSHFHRQLRKMVLLEYRILFCLVFTG
jgi:hypothetical protein